MSAQQFEHDGFNSPNEVEVAKRAARHTPPAYSPENPAPLRRDGESIADYRVRCGWDAALHTPAERIVMNDAVQAACQRYAHGNGSSVSIVAAVLRAAGYEALLQGLNDTASICIVPASNQQEHEFDAAELRRKLFAANDCARSAIAAATGSASHG
jgi:hypothetical protein